MATVNLTTNQINQVLWAIELTEDSFEGWTAEEKGAEVVKDLATLKRAYARLCEAIGATN